MVLLFQACLADNRQVNGQETDNTRKFDETSKTPQSSRTIKGETAKSGTMKVMVRLKVDGIDELMRYAAQLKESEAVNQVQAQIESRINAVADSVLEKIAHTAPKIIHRYSTLPLLALEVSPEAVSFLKAIPEVENVTVDKPVPLN